LPGLPVLAGNEVGTFSAGDFPWSFFVPGYLLMAAGLGVVCYRGASPAALAGPW
jgi:hypothetical protein